MILKISRESTAQDFQKEVLKFLKSLTRNKWIYLTVVKIYVRKSKRYLDLPISHYKDLEECFDIASISIEKEYQNQGYFKSLLLALTEINPYNYIYIEAVQNEHLTYYLKKSGWIETKDGNSFYMENELLQALLILEK
jgi:hypothetical protein